MELPITHWNLKMRTKTIKHFESTCKSGAIQRAFVGDLRRTIVTTKLNKFIMKLTDTRTQLISFDNNLFNMKRIL